MKQLVLSLLLTIAFVNFGQAQEVEMEKVFGGYVYRQDGTLLTMKELSKLIESNRQAATLLKQSSSLNTLSFIIGAAGGALVGFPLGTAAGGGDPEWSMVGIGAGLIAVALPISIIASSKAKKAVELYNSSLNSTSYYKTRPEFNLFAKANGLGLAITF